MSGGDTGDAMAPVGRRVIARPPTRQTPTAAPTSAHRLVKITYPTGFIAHRWVLPPGLLEDSPSKLDFPFRLQRERHVRFTIRDDLLYVNDKLVGIDLTGVSSQRAVRLIRLHARSIRIIRWHHARHLFPQVTKELSQLPSRGIRVSIQDYQGKNAAAFRWLRKLDGRLETLILRGTRRGFGRASTAILRAMGPQRALRHLIFDSVYVSGLAVIARFTNLERLSLYADESRRLSKTDIRALRAIRSLSSLRINSSGFAVTTSADWFAELGSNRRLAVLDANGFTKTSFKQLIAMGSLKALTIADGKTTGGIFGERASALGGLKYLDISELQLNAAFVKKQAGSLQFLRFQNPVHDAYRNGSEAKQRSKSLLRNAGRLRSLQWLEYHGPLAQTMPPALSGLSALRVLRLHSLQAAPMGVASLIRSVQGLPTLRELSLGQRLTRPLCRHLGNLRQLESLAITQTKRSTVVPVCFTDLGRLERLESLSIAGVTMPPGGTRELSRLSRLRSLTLSNVGPLSADSVKHLAKLRGLESLSLCSVPLSAKGLAALATLKRLRYLSVRPGQTAEATRALAGLKELRVLELCGSRLDKQAVAALATLPQLRTLILRGTKVTLPALQQLRQSASLRILALLETNLSRAQWRALQKQLSPRVLRFKSLKDPPLYYDVKQRPSP